MREAVEKLGASAIAVKADVLSLTDLDNLATRVNEEFGSLDILFANAGRGYFSPLEQVDGKFYDSQFDINVKGVFFTVQKLVGF